jgi:NitT/TauT family transport system permease protein
MTAQNLARSLYPLLGVMVILTLWQLYTSLSGISPLVLPSPIEIASVCIERYDLLLQQTWPTFVETVLGFALALVIGIPLAVFVANSRLFNLVLYPILVATQSIPKVAIAPIILVWFGLGISSKLALAFLVAFFPIVVDTAAGLQATPPGLLELAHALCASRRQVFVKVQMPAALPFIFA